jgi:hypothetical protein
MQVAGKRAPQASSQHIMRDPCLRCGVKGELGCKHGTVRWLTGTVFA